jgi:hypothetical protein
VSQLNKWDRSLWHIPDGWYCHGVRSSGCPSSAASPTRQTQWWLNCCLVGNSNIRPCQNQMLVQVVTCAGVVCNYLPFVASKLNRQGQSGVRLLAPGGSSSIKASSRCQLEGSNRECKLWTGDWIAVLVGLKEVGNGQSQVRGNISSSASGIQGICPLTDGLCHMPQDNVFNSLGCYHPFVPKESFSSLCKKALH